MKNKAYSLAEVMLSLAIWGVIGSLTVSVFIGANDYINKNKLKNMTLELKKGLNQVITNPYYYSENEDLANLDSATVEDTSDASVEIYRGLSKFRELLLKELGVSTSKSQRCYMMLNDKNISIDNCYVGSNNVLWGIPDTDFVEKNIVFAKNPSGSVYKYLPVTIYPDIKNISKIEDFDRYAIVYGIRRDGDVTIINNIDCTDSKYKKYNQCLCAEAVASK